MVLQPGRVEWRSELAIHTDTQQGGALVPGTLKNSESASFSFKRLRRAKMRFLTMACSSGLSDGKKDPRSSTTYTSREPPPPPAKRTTTKEPRVSARKHPSGCTGDSWAGTHVRAQLGPLKLVSWRFLATLQGTRPGQTRRLTLGPCPPSPLPKWRRTGVIRSEPPMAGANLDSFDTHAKGVGGAQPLTEHHVPGQNANIAHVNGLRPLGLAMEAMLT